MRNGPKRISLYCRTLFQHLGGSPLAQFAKFKGNGVGKATHCQAGMQAGTNTHREMKSDPKSLYFPVLVWRSVEAWMRAPLTPPGEGESPRVLCGVLVVSMARKKEEEIVDAPHLCDIDKALVSRLTVIGMSTGSTELRCVSIRSDCDSESIENKSICVAHGQAKRAGEWSCETQRQRQIYGGRTGLASPHCDRYFRGSTPG